MRACWAKQDQSAAGDLDTAYGRVVAEMRRLGMSTAPLEAATAAWEAARSKTCAFEYALYLPGTIAPQLQTQCDVRTMQARTHRLNVLLTALASHGAATEPQTSTRDAQHQLDRFYASYRSRVDPEHRPALAAAESAWEIYSEKECAIEGGSCAADLAKERIAQLEESWLGEPFW